MKKKKIRKINLKLAFQILIITTIISSMLSISRYRSSVDMDDTALIAVPVLESTTVNLTNIHPAMQPKEYELVVKNFKNLSKVLENNLVENTEVVTEVNMSYKIHIEQLGNLPLKIEIYNSENGEKNGANLLLNGENILETKDIQVPINKTEQKYKLIISWDTSDNKYLDYKYNGEISYIKIDVNSVQVD